MREGIGGEGGRGGDVVAVCRALYGSVMEERLTVAETPGGASALAAPPPPSPATRPCTQATRVTQGGESQARTPAHIRLFRAYATRGQTIHAVHKVLSGESTTIGSPERTPFFRIGWRCRRHIRVVPFYPFRPLLDLVDLTLFRYRVLAVHSILCARRERAFQCAF